MKKYKNLAIIFGCFTLAAGSFTLGAAVQLHLDNDNLMYLHQALLEKDSLLDMQEAYLIDLTYQHEDDDKYIEEVKK